MVASQRAEDLNYTGEPAFQPKPNDPTGQRPYLPKPELTEAVQLAIQLERPLLIKGEPGCGKTQLARAVAYELGQRNNVRWPFEAWYVKSTSRARDGLYRYDAVRRLRDAQLAAAGRLSDADMASLDLPRTYVRFGPLGNALLTKGRRAVVLIDEIDKADIDFPNDLLLELDERKFEVEETDEEITASQSPIVIITSNDEKDLPDAFLRRCLFHYIEFPTDNQLKAIVRAHFPVSPEGLVDAAIARFIELRRQMREDKGESGKRVSTSELLDWFRVLQNYSGDAEFDRVRHELLYPGVLLKSWDDYRRYATTGEVKVTG